MAGVVDRKHAVDEACSVIWCVGHRLLHRDELWQQSSVCVYEIRGSVFTRSVSAAPVVACVLNPQDESSSSNLTSKNASVLTSRPPHTRRVTRSNAETTVFRCG